MNRLVLLVSFVSSSPFAQIPEHYYRTFTHDTPVFKRIKPGEVVVTKTLDSGRKDFRGEQISGEGNTLTGPFYVEGAEPGDAIRVTLRKVRLNRNSGYAVALLGLYSLSSSFLKRAGGGLSFAGFQFLNWDLDLDTAQCGFASRRVQE